MENGKLFLCTALLAAALTLTLTACESVCGDGLCDLGENCLEDCSRYLPSDPYEPNIPSDAGIDGSDEALSPDADDTDSEVVEEAEDPLTGPANLVIGNHIPRPELAEYVDGQHVCDNPLLPVLCMQNGLCWPEGTDCDSELFSCGGAGRHCGSNDGYATCCSGTFVTCGNNDGLRYGCPSSATCYESLSEFIEQCPEYNNCRPRGQACY